MFLPATIGKLTASVGGVNPLNMPGVLAFMIEEGKVFLEGGAYRVAVAGVEGKP